MILNQSLKLCAQISSTASSGCHVHVDFADWTNANELNAPDTNRSLVVSAVTVDILAAPISNPKREPTRVIVHNPDSLSAIVRIFTTDGTTARDEVRRTLTTLQSLCWEKYTGWYVLATS